MTILINSQGELRRRFDAIPFCYLCGNLFDNKASKTRDHVPPKGIFKKCDREDPLLLPAHRECNLAWSQADDQIAALFSLLHGIAPRKVPGAKAHGIVSTGNNSNGILISNLALAPLVSRIVRACHSMLYETFLPIDCSQKFLLPVPEFDIQTHQLHSDMNLVQHGKFARKLKDTRRMKGVDSLVAYNGRFRFEACWATDDTGKCDFCICGIKIYNWEELGDTVLGRIQGCIGSYRMPSDSSPANASRALAGESPFTYSEPLNPFENCLPR